MSLKKMKKEELELLSNKDIAYLILEESKRKLKQNNDKIRKKLTIEVEKHPKGIMVAGGVSSFGVGKLNFCVGTMNSFA